MMVGRGCLIVGVLLVVVGVARGAHVNEFDKAKSALVAEETALCQVDQDCVTPEVREDSRLCWAVGQSGVEGKKLVRCPKGTACVIDRMVSNPYYTNAETHVIRAGCAAALKPNDLECGAVACPMTEYLFATECCDADGCNNPTMSKTFTVNKADCQAEFPLVADHGCNSGAGYKACEATGKCYQPAQDGIGGPCPQMAEGASSNSTAGRLSLISASAMVPADARREVSVVASVSAPDVAAGDDSSTSESDVAMVDSKAVSEDDYVQILGLSETGNEKAPAALGGKVGRVIGPSPQAGGLLDVEVSGMVYTLDPSVLLPITREDAESHGALEAARHEGNAAATAADFAFTEHDSSNAGGGSVAPVAPVVEAGEGALSMGVIEAGSKVRVVGLVQDARFNGEVGLAPEGSDQDGNVRVKLHGKSFKLKKQNLVVVS